MNKRVKESFLGERIQLLRNMTINFGAGPSKLPTEVLVKLTYSILQYKLTGMSIVEISHRSQHFQELFFETVSALRDLLNVPDNYEILLMQGGASSQFSAIPMNMKGRIKDSEVEEDSEVPNLTNPYYKITGYWSKKAEIEAKKYFDKSISSSESQKCLSTALYYHYCANETAEGIRIPFPTDVPINVPIFCDMSSYIFSEQIDISKYGCVYFGAQKNCGIPGVTVVIIRKDLVSTPIPECPSTLSYKLTVEKGKNNCTINTPSVISIYSLYLMTQWIKDQDSLFVDETLFKINNRKAKRLYDFIDDKPRYFETNVPRDKNYPFITLSENRSITNITFKFIIPELNEKFVDKAAESGIIGVKGHTSQGGLRVSLYNSITMNEVTRLMQFIIEFIKEHC